MLRLQPQPQFSAHHRIQQDLLLIANSPVGRVSLPSCLSQVIKKKNDCHPESVRAASSLSSGIEGSRYDDDLWLLSWFLRSELPHSPRSLTARLNDSDSRSVFLSWLRPFDGNSPLLYYVLELSENSKCVRVWVRVQFSVCFSA